MPVGQGYVPQNSGLEGDTEMETLEKREARRIREREAERRRDAERVWRGL